MVTRTVNNGNLQLSKDGEVILSIFEELKNDAIYIKVDGIVSADVAHEFEDELMATVTFCKKITIDLKNVTYISSAGMKVLLSLQKIIDNENGGYLKLLNLSAEVFKAFEEIGFDDLFNIE